MSKLYKVDFNDLFDTERQAVVCYLSLERRYLSLVKQFDRCKEIAALVPDFDLNNILLERLKEQTI